MVVLEMEFLYEIRRSRLTADEVLLKLEAETAVRVCSLPFAEVSRIATQEKWTRDPFDRLIVANAKAKGFAWLITDDRQIHSHYERALD
jgi:PIN domain nuclease of toxin-antitoxin system